MTDVPQNAPESGWWMVWYFIVLVVAIIVAGMGTVDLIIRGDVVFGLGRVVTGLALIWWSVSGLYNIRKEDRSSLGLFPDRPDRD